MGTDEAIPSQDGQCECGLPVPHKPQERGCPVQAGSAGSPATLEAKTESFFTSRVDPQRGHSVPSQLLERTRTSLSAPHLSQ